MSSERVSSRTGVKPRVSATNSKSVQFAATPQFKMWSANQSESNISAILSSLLELSDEDEIGRNLLEDIDSFDWSGVWDKESVARLVEEEAEDVRLAVLLAGEGEGAEAPRFPLDESLRHVHRDIRAMPISDNLSVLEQGDDPDKLSAAAIAEMMHRLEHGISMFSPPDQLFKFLFSQHEAVAPEVEGAGEAEDGGGGGTLHKKEPCPIICFGGAEPLGGAGAEARTAVQLRGDQPPSWFPGYYMALPQTGGMLEVKTSPTDVMHAAYLAGRPRNIPPHCRIVY